MRDTVTINRYSYLVLRFADKNPGLWLMHCHVNWHDKAGMMMIFHEVGR
jgi:iron transport multicopper oxidase